MDQPRSPSFTIQQTPAQLPVVGVTDEGLGNTTWVASLGGEALVIDPERAPEPYLDALEQLTGRRAIDVLVAETHLHADFVSGARGLAAEGARAVAPAAADLQWTHRPVVDRERIDLGRWQLEVLPTPGHTPEHVAYLLRESGHPTAVFTGGSLLVGSVARTDLIDPADTERLTRELWHAINHELLSLPDDVVVLPTHGAGSFCSAASDSRRWTTIGDERRANPLLQADEASFVRAVLDSFESYPPYFLRLRAVNRVGPHVYGALPPLDELTAERAGALRDQGATIIDVRAVADYAAAHLPDSLAITLRPQFSSWLGWLVEDPATPLVFVIDDHTDCVELIRQCLNVGYENLVGTITMSAWRAGRGDLRTTPLVVEEPAGQVLDVRQASEFATGHVAGATNVELGRLAQLHATVPAGPLTAMCAHGERAASAASLLEARGRDDVAIAIGDTDHWAARSRVFPEA